MQSCANLLLYESQQTLNNPALDYSPIKIQFLISLIIILLINLYFIYVFGVQIYNMFNERQDERLHDVYDKLLIFGGFKCIAVNIFCLIWFHNITTQPMMMIKMFWLANLILVLAKFYYQTILYPFMAILTALIIFSTIYWYLINQFPLQKIVIIQITFIIILGFYQTIKISKILNLNYHSTSYTLTKLLSQSKNQSQLRSSLLSLGYPLLQQKLDQTIRSHLQNRRSFCFVCGVVLTIHGVLMVDLEFARDLVGEVMMSLAMDLMPFYVVLWYLTKFQNIKTIRDHSEKSIRQIQCQDRTTSRQSSTSQIVIQLIDISKNRS